MRGEERNRFGRAWVTFSRWFDVVSGMMDLICRRLVAWWRRMRSGTG